MPEAGVAALPTPNSRSAAQRRRPRAALRERELSRLWQEQRLPPEALVTADGASVDVIYRGRRGLGPGPDFRDAVIRLTPRLSPRLPGEEAAVDAITLRGDVELHVRSSDFRRHGHHEDRAYLRLALHVVFEDDGGPTQLQDGRTVPTVALGRWVQRRAGEISLALAPAEPYREPCHTARERLGAERVRELLLEGGRRRLREHAARLAPLLEAAGPDQALYVALARALG